MYTLLRFSDYLILDIPDIDSQHQQIAGIINQIIKSLHLQHHNTPPFTLRNSQSNNSSSKWDNTFENSYHTKQDINQHLDDLIKFTEEHFLDEERLMKKIGYPGFIEHKREHMLLMAELKAFIRNTKNGTEQLDLKSIDSLKSWFVQHIRSSDKEFANAFHKELPDTEKSHRGTSHKQT